MYREYFHTTHILHVLFIESCVHPIRLVPNIIPIINVVCCFPYK